MAKTKISDEHLLAAQAQVDALARAGFKATVREVLLAAVISNAIESVVTLAHVGSDEAPARPELDTAAARRLFVAEDESAVREFTNSTPFLDEAATTAARLRARKEADATISCIAIARGLLRARKPSQSLERQGHHIGQALVEMFAVMDAAGPERPGL